MANSTLINDYERPLEGINQDQDFKYTDLWVIYTFRKNYRIFKPLLDPETYELREVTRRDGIRGLEVHPLSSGLKAKGRAAESLPSTPEREKATLWCTSNPNGVFHCRNGKLAKLIWEHVKGDPKPYPQLDPHNPPFPTDDAPVIPVEETKASTDNPDGPPARPWVEKKD